MGIYTVIATFPRARPSSRKRMASGTSASPIKGRGELPGLDEVLV
jgi:hypothetical protein